MKDYNTKNTNEDLENITDENTKLSDNPINAFLQKNGTKIIIAAASIVLLVILIFLYNVNKQQNEKDATIALSRIEIYHQAGEYDNALNAPDELPLVRGEKVIGLTEIINK